jgi:WD40 repeat protein
VLKGHTDRVKGVLVLADGRILSWSWDSSLRLWDAQSGQCLAELHGHRGHVEGALALTDGRILSWSVDSSLRLWDAQRGRCLAVLEGDSKLLDPIISANNCVDFVRALEESSPHWVQGALALADGQILSWSSNSLRLWDGKSGRILETVLANEVGKKHCEWLYAREKFRNPSSVYDDWFAGSSGWSVSLHNQNTGHIALAAWNADSKASCHMLSTDGTVVITEDSGHVFILKLHHGNRRVFLAEAEKIIAPQIRLALEQARLKQEAEDKRKIIRSIKSIDEHFLKGHWEFVSMECEKLLAHGESLSEYGPKLITCLLNAHEDLSAADASRIEALLQELDNAGLETLATPLRMQLAKKKNISAPKKLFWKFW